MPFTVQLPALEPPSPPKDFTFPFPTPSERTVLCAECHVSCGILKGMQVSAIVPDTCMLLNRVQWEKKHGAITEDYIHTSVKGAIIGGSLK